MVSFGLAMGVRCILLTSQPSAATAELEAQILKTSCPPSHSSYLILTSVVAADAVKFPAHVEFVATQLAPDMAGGAVFVLKRSCLGCSDTT